MRFKYHVVALAIFIVLATVWTSQAAIRPINPLSKEFVDRGASKQPIPKPCIVENKPAVLKWTIIFPDGKIKRIGEIAIKRECVR